MATAQKIAREQLRHFHAAVAAAFSEGAGLNVHVEGVDETLEWEKALAGTQVFFAAKPAASNVPVEFLRDGSITFRFSELGALVPLWVSWGEEWVKATSVRGQRQMEPALDFVGVSICFYAGNAARQKTQILRAEWDNPLQRGGNAAQPHWHIDPDLIDLPSWKSEETGQVPSGLEELRAPESPLIQSDPGFWGLQRLHLGMGGWKHHAVSPQCWQHKVDFDTLSEWLKRVLVYCGCELPRVTAV